MAGGARLTMLAGLLMWKATSVHAPQPISGNYPGGAVTGMKASITLPVGSFLLENGTLIYNTRESVDGGGETIPTDISNIVANRMIIGYVTPWR